MKLHKNYQTVNTIIKKRNLEREVIDVDVNWPVKIKIQKLWKITVKETWRSRTKRVLVECNLVLLNNQFFFIVLENIYTQWSLVIYHYLSFNNYYEAV